MDEDCSGFVYVMIKERTPFLKVGQTEKKPQLRAAELDGTDSPTPSIVVYYAFCSDAVALERLAHQGLSGFRVRSNREWFECDPLKAVNAIQNAARSKGIDLHYEKSFLSGSTGSASEGSLQIAPEMDIDAVIQHINICRNRIFGAFNSFSIEAASYRARLEERKVELRRESQSGMSTKGAESFANAAYRGKIQELREGVSMKLSTALRDVELELGVLVSAKVWAQVSRILGDAANQFILVKLECLDFKQQEFPIFGRDTVILKYLDEVFEAGEQDLRSVDLSLLQVSD